MEFTGRFFLVGVFFTARLFTEVFFAGLSFKAPLPLPFFELSLFTMSHSTISQNEIYGV
jgi:hypothetical protein